MEIHRSRSAIRLGVILFGIFMTTACDPLPDSFYHRSWLGKCKFLLLTALGRPPGNHSKGKPKPGPSGSPTQQKSEGELSSVAAQNSKAHSELFHEMYRVVFNREPKDRAQFGNWVDTLNQGASLEGVHNGLTKSAEYRKLEMTQGAASVEALTTFAGELALFEAELPQATQFDSLTYAPLVQAERAAPAVQGFAAPKSDPSQPDPEIPPARIMELAGRYSKQFVGASVYTLKRTLSDEAMKVLDQKNEFKEKMALWYSRWVSHMAQKKVDFGVPLRNKIDEAFHYKWAVQSTTDRVKWEVLNRIHRIMNEANRQKQ